MSKIKPLPVGSALELECQMKDYGTRHEILIQQAEMMRIKQQMAHAQIGPGGYSGVEKTNAPRAEHTVRFWEQLLECVDRSRADRLLDPPEKREEFEKLAEYASKRLADMVLERLTREQMDHKADAVSYSIGAASPGHSHSIAAQGGGGNHSIEIMPGVTVPVNTDPGLLAKLRDWCKEPF